MSKILHIGPAKHGIAAYDLQIDAIYRQQGFEVEPVLVGADSNLGELADKLAAQTEAVCHFEIGSGDSAVFGLSQRLLRLTGRRQLVTIHDPGVVVRHPVSVPGVGSAWAVVRVGAKIGRKLVTKLFSRVIIRHFLGDSRIYKVYLRPDLAEGERSYFLPQPTYHSRLPKAPGDLRPPARIGFGGYWGYGKGLETFLEAVKLVRAGGGPAFSLVVGGGTADADDHYARSMRQLAREVDAAVELPGFVADDELDDFLQSLNGLVLPYWPELPNGTSAMAMRAAELAVPIIASDTLALKGQLGAEGAVYVEPKNPEALARAIEQLVTSGEVFRDRARQTQAKIFASHNWSAVGEKLRGIIESMEGGGQ